MLKELDSTTDKAKAFDEAYAKYHAAMEAVNRLNDYGFYDEDSYNLEFSEKLKDVMDALKDGVYDKVRAMIVCSLSWLNPEHVVMLRT